MTLKQKLQAIYVDLSDDVLDILIENAQCELLLLTRLNELPTEAEIVLFKMIQENIGKLGEEALKSTTAAGVNIEYFEDYSPMTLRLIDKLRARC